MTDRRRHPKIRHRIAERWTPLFPAGEIVEPLTAEEFADACDWERLRADGLVGPHDDPLATAGLRLSALFPRHLLRRRDDGRLVPISFDDAVSLVGLTVAQNERTREHLTAGRPATDGPANRSEVADVPDVAEVSQVPELLTVDDATEAARDGIVATASGANPNRKRFFRRRG